MMLSIVFIDSLKLFMSMVEKEFLGKYSPEFGAPKYIGNANPR